MLMQRCAEGVQGGERCARRVKVYQSARDRWNMGMCVELSTQDGCSMARVLYDNGGSQWVNLDQLNVLELCDVSVGPG